MDKEQRERLKASREIGQAFRTIQAIRALYFVTAATALLLAAYAANDNLVGAVVFLGGGLMSIYGAGQVRDTPGPWSIGMAVIISGIVAMMILTSSHADVMTIWGTAIAVALWCVIPLAFNSQKLMERHPDLYITQKFQGSRRDAPTTERSKRIHAETRRQKEAARNKAIVFFGAFVVLAAAVLVLPGMLAKDEAPPEEKPEPEFGSRANNFLQAWNRGDWAAVEKFLHPDDRARRWPKIKRLMKKRGWDIKPPRLKPPRIERVGYYKSYYNLLGFDDEIVFTVYWAHDDEAWWWDKTRWPKTDLVKR